MTERADTMTRPKILDLDLVVVPREATDEMQFAGNANVYDAMLSASPYPTAWDDVRKYVEGLETEVERLKDELGDPDGVVAHADSITELSEARIAELEKRLADAERVIEPFADEAGAWIIYDNDERIVESFPDYHGNLRVRQLRAARAYMEGK